LSLDLIHEPFNRDFSAKEKWSVLLAKVKKPTVWADGGADSIEVSLEIRTRLLSAGSFGQNCNPNVERLASQIHPSELTKKT
jgi:hypothetical protein